ncbi:TVP38/TMEM64 family protein [Paenibacillus cremeus]|uniref:TVP38/TMEM64 family membrane protein n=1 Tax=Paenibacillus cremeus TaxID=2163881 RepID=A0A559K9A7_9BACL|nr:TVP38/TMEM64 family protein [Paenibacillus cremeus]TVY08715.1 TVP38/TMEM64 family protein [Paenibacillus cremeus]
MFLWNIRHLSDELNSFGWYGHVVGALLVVLQTIVPFVPFVVVAGANVLLFGFWGGFIVNYIFSCLGAIIAFFVARNYGQTWVQNKLSKYSHLEVINEKLERHGLLYILLSRVIPVVPSFAINLISAVLKVRRRDFIIGSIIGKFPMIWLESMIGHDLLHFHKYKGRLLILVGIFLITLLIGNYYKKKWFTK